MRKTKLYLKVVGASLLIVILLWVCFVSPSYFLSFGNFTGRDLSDYSRIEGESTWVTPEEITDIVIDTVAGDVIVLPSVLDTVDIYYTDDGVDCLYKVDSGTLYITTDVANGGFHLFQNNVDEGIVTVGVPAVLDQVDYGIHTVSGTVQVSAPGNGLSISTVSGGMDLKAVCKDIDLETVSGDGKLSHSGEAINSVPYNTTALSWESVSGNLTLVGPFHYDLDMDSVSSSETGRSYPSAGEQIAIDFESVSGNFRCN